MKTKYGTLMAAVVTCALAGIGVGALLSFEREASTSSFRDVGVRVIRARAAQLWREEGELWLRADELLALIDRAVVEGGYRDSETFLVVGHTGAGGPLYALVAPMNADDERRVKAAFRANGLPLK